MRKQLAALPRTEADAVWVALQALPVGFGRPHVHAGIGIRQLRLGVYELRVGLHLRAVFGREGNQLVVRMVGTHDDVRRYLRRI